MISREKRQKLSNCFGYSDEAGSRSSCKYRIIYEEVAGRTGGICSCEECTLPMSSIYFFGDLSTDALENSLFWKSTCRRHKRSLLGNETVSPVVESSSHFAPAPFNSTITSHSVNSLEREFFHLNGGNS